MSQPPLLAGPNCLLIGMVHLQPLPGSPGWTGNISTVMQAAVRDAERLKAGGCDALLVENMGDLPYLRGRVEPETVAAMAIAIERVKQVGLPVGVQILAGANREALGVAVAAGARFVRVEAFAYGHVADEGWMDACAGPLLRSRAGLGAQVEIWADVQKKHAAHSVTSDLTLEDLARGHAFSGADALIITGVETGRPTSVEHLKRARVAGLPVVVGSGVGRKDVGVLSTYADALIVGSSIKHTGHWTGEVDERRVRQIRDAMRGQ